MYRLRDQSPECPICGTAVTALRPEPFARELPCPECGEPVRVPGDPAAPDARWRRPFWSDQFVLHFDPHAGIPPADLLMYGFVAGLTSVITLAAFVATAPK